VDNLLCFWSHDHPHHALPKESPQVRCADLHGRLETSLFWSGWTTGTPALEERSRPIAGGVWGYADTLSAHADLRWAVRMAIDAFAPDRRDGIALDNDVRDAFSSGRLGLVLGRDFLLVTGHHGNHHTPTLQPSHFFKGERPSTTPGWEQCWIVPEAVRGTDLQTVATIGAGIRYDLDFTSAHERVACAARMAEDWALVNAYWARHGQPCLERSDVFLVLRD
jgi:hypothetical protein